MLIYLRFSGPLTKDRLGRSRRKQMFREEGTSGETRISLTAALARGQARERFWHPVRVVSWPSEEHWSLAEGQLSGLLSPC
jgi:hypothetical protein